MLMKAGQFYLRFVPSRLIPRAETARKERSTGIFATKPALYLLVLVCSILGTFAYKVRTQSIFACPADGYASDHYLAYCHADGYGDYDRGAFWFDLEPEAQRGAANAQVLFLGSSRMEFAFSTAATDNWFSSHALRYYLLGFADFENAVFASPLLVKLKPQAKVYVINIDRFFSDETRPPTREVLQDADAGTRYRHKQYWQSLHESICSRVPALCGDRVAFFRFRENGAWQLKGWSTTFGARSPVSDGPARDSENWQHYAALGERFLSQLPVDRRCVILTIAPYVGTRLAEAKAIAGALGVDLVAPQLNGLETFDTSHLDRPSAERWASAFFQAAGPRILQCAEDSRTTPR
jgi:hypothetical protein